MYFFGKNFAKQECIPVACVPPAQRQLGGLCPGGLPGGVCPGGVPCDLSHHAFDVTCMLPPHQLRATNSAAAYIVVVQGMMGYTPPVNRITDTCKNITFPQLHLRVVIIDWRTSSWNWRALWEILESPLIMDSGYIIPLKFSAGFRISQKGTSKRGVLSYYFAIFFP